MEDDESAKAKKTAEVLTIEGVSRNADVYGDGKSTAHQGDDVSGSLRQGFKKLNSGGPGRAPDGPRVWRNNYRRGRVDAVVIGQRLLINRPHV